MIRNEAGHPVSTAQKLELKQRQQLVMTPQLQQAIKLLQLTNLELMKFVEEQLIQNPFLELDESASLPQRGDGAHHDTQDASAASVGEREITLCNQNSNVDTVGELDTDYDNIDANKPPSEGVALAEPTGPSGDYASGIDPYRHEKAKSLASTDRLVRDISLKEHLTTQLHLSAMDAVNLLIGTLLIDHIDDDGYLRADITQLATQFGIKVARVEHVLRVIQECEPVGVGARDLTECLTLQLKERDKYTPLMARFVGHLDMLAKADMKGLCQKLAISRETLNEMIAEIRTLTPKPGYMFGGTNAQLVIPDIYVSQNSEGGWNIELNNDTLPKVLVNQKYFVQLNKECVQEQEKSFLSQHISNANWLVKSLDQRARTILKVTSEIVRQQDAFFIHGIQYLKPLNLKVVAEAIAMHESTVSRVTANKYVSTPRGVFELKYFFTAAIASATGEERYASEAIRRRIKNLIDTEKPGAILSDDKIVALLRLENIDIARRTVAKYRETLRIPSSVQRRRLK